MKTLASILFVIFSPVITILLGIISIVGVPIGLIYSATRPRDNQFQSGSRPPIPFSLDRVNVH